MTKKIFWEMKVSFWTTKSLSDHLYGRSGDFWYSPTRKHGRYGDLTKRSIVRNIPQTVWYQDETYSSWHNFSTPSQMTIQVLVWSILIVELVNERIKDNSSALHLVHFIYYWISVFQILHLTVRSPPSNIPSSMWSTVLVVSVPLVLYHKLWSISRRWYRQRAIQHVIFKR